MIYYQAELSVGTTQIQQKGTNVLQITALSENNENRAFFSRILHMVIHNLLRQYCSHVRNLWAIYASICLYYRSMSCLRCLVIFGYLIQLRFWLGSSIRLPGAPSKTLCAINQRFGWRGGGYILSSHFCALFTSFKASRSSQKRKCAYEHGRS